jgi:DNA-binding transcriptional regulator YiaG
MFEEVEQGRIQYLTPDEFVHLLIKANLTPLQFANVIGVTQRSVERWQDGKYPIPPMVCSIIVLLAKRRITARSFIEARL